MAIPEGDSQYLTERAPGYSIINEGSMVCVIIPRFRVPSSFGVTESDLLIRLSSGYPDVPPDMWWFDPPLRRTDGQIVPATDQFEQHLGRTWQRWSR
ncbi:MAG TPA: E2/UBC family protein, partial [Caulobacteraceae bacterium]